MSEKTKRAGDDGSTSPGLLYAIRFLTLVAMAMSAYLAWVTLSGGAVAGCGPDSGCDKVLHSRWAYWLGVPVSLGALAVYALILRLSVRLGRGTTPVVQRKAWSRLVPCALLVAGAAIWFVGLQVFVVQAVCPYCMVAHISGSLAALLLLLGAPLRPAPEKPWELDEQIFLTTRVFKRVALIALAGLAGLVFGQLAHQPRTYRVKSLDVNSSATNSAHSSAAAAEPTQELARVQPPTNVAVHPGSKPGPGMEPPAPAARRLPIYGGRFQLDLEKTPVIGPPTNRWVAVSLFDYTCHHCRAMHALLVEVQRMYSNDLAIVSLPMPLDPGCNPTVTRAHPMHTNACEYARLGLAVWRAAREKHPAFDLWLFDGEKPPPLPATRDYAAQLVGTNLLNQALQDRWVEQQLKLDVAIYELAYRSGQGQMPQLILGDKVAVGSYLRDDLIKMLVEHLGLKGGPN